VSENLPPAKQTTSGMVAVLSLPSSLLIQGKDYTIDLLYAEAGRRWGELDSFTFHVAAKK